MYDICVCVIFEYIISEWTQTIHFITKKYFAIKPKAIVVWHALNKVKSAQKS